MATLQRCSHIGTTVRLHHLDSNKALRIKARWQLHKDTMCCFKQILEAVPYKNTCSMATYLSFHKQSN